VSELRTWKCDVCGHQKQDVNHWWLITSMPGGVILLGPWIEEGALDADFHLCGRECAQKKIEEWMNAQMSAPKGVTA
jgi:hypothetical protein